MDIRAIIGILESFNSVVLEHESTMEKFWVDCRRKHVLPVNDEHFEDVNCPEEPFENGYARAGFSYHTDKIYIEARTLSDIRIATRLLLKDYRDAVGLVYDINSPDGSITDARDLDRYEMLAFVRKQ